MGNKKTKKTTKKRGKKSTLLFRLFLLGAVVAAIGTVVAVIGYFYLAAELPNIEKIADYRPASGTKVYSYGGELIAEFYRNNRRNIVPYDKLPKKLRLAFVAGEDAEFYHHYGIRPLAMLRAGIRWMLTGVKQGGSTITQQLAKSFISSRRTFKRKFKDMILAVKLEHHFTKEEILYLYLNEIFLGSGAYGVESAARTYFDKHVWELSLPEMATLAGLPKYPSKASPINNPKRAKKRRNYVLHRMLEEGFISEEEYKKAVHAPMAVHPAKELMLDKAPYFTEKVRRHLLKKYGEKKLYDEGLIVYTTVDMRATRLAHEAVFKGLRELSKRQGYRRDAAHSVIPGKKFQGSVTNPLYHINLRKELAVYKKRYKKAFGEISAETIRRGTQYQGVVLKVVDNSATVLVGSVKRKVHLDDLRWAKEWKPLGGWAQVKSVSEVLKPGDVVLVRATDQPGTRDVFDHRNHTKPLPKDFFFVLEQVPATQAAIIVKDPFSGYIKAIMGGFDFEVSEFDRTSQACRQPGSAIKPLFYSHALEPYPGNDGKPLFTSASMILDAPVTVADANFKPSNYENTFKGEVTFWEALVHSMNTPSIRVLQKMGLRYAIDGVHKLGIKSTIRPEYGSILGSSCLTLDELTDAYAHFPNKGKHPHTTYIRKVLDQRARTLENNTVFYDPYLTAAEKIDRILSFSGVEEVSGLSEQAAYITTRILEDVINRGTGVRASIMNYKDKRHVAGKTGTTNDYLDAWFIGFNPDVVAGVWVGNDKHGVPLGHSETGSKAALPIWFDFMRRYLATFPTKDYEQPDHIVSESIDPKTGLIAGEKGGVRMFFISGTQPTSTNEEKKILDPTKGMDGVL